MQFIFPGVKLADMKSNVHFHLVPRLRMSGVVPLLPLSVFAAWIGTALPFFMLCMKYSFDDY
jgi:hypothetical protein